MSKCLWAAGSTPEGRRGRAISCSFARPVSGLHWIKGRILRWYPNNSCLGLMNHYIPQKDLHRWCQWCVLSQLRPTVQRKEAFLIPELKWQQKTRQSENNLAQKFLEVSLLSSYFEKVWGLWRTMTSTVIINEERQNKGSVIFLSRVNLALLNLIVSWDPRLTASYHNSKRYKCSLYSASVV